MAETTTATEPSQLEQARAEVERCETWLEEERANVERCQAFAAEAHRDLTVATRAHQEAQAFADLRRAREHVKECRTVELDAQEMLQDAMRARENAQTALGAARGRWDILQRTVERLRAEHREMAERCDRLERRSRLSAGADAEQAARLLEAHRRALALIFQQLADLGVEVPVVDGA